MRFNKPLKSFNTRLTRPTKQDRPKGEISQLKYVYAYVRPYRWQVVGALLALMVAAGTTLGLGWALRYLVDEGLARGHGGMLDQAYAILLGMSLLLASASYLRTYFVSQTSEHVVADIRRDVYRRMIGMHIGYFEMARTGELLSRLTTDTAMLQTVIGGSMTQTIRNSLILVGGLVMLLVTSTKLALYVLLLAPVVIAPIILLGRKVRILARETQERLADLNVHAEESLNAIRTIQSLAIESENKQIFGQRVDTVLAAALNRVRTRALLNAIVILLVFGAVATVVWIGGRDTLTGGITTGELASFVFYSVLVSSAVGALTDVVADVQRAAGAAERVQEVLELVPEIASPAQPRPLPDMAQAQVSFDHVRFFYPSRKDKASVEDFTLDVAPGKTVALVGPSGAGKTTIFQLLLRFYDPASGSIHINGVDIRDVDLENMRRMISIVPQDPVIFSASAADNIRIGRNDATDEELIQAAQAACALEFIEKLPQGFATHVGEKGVRLSGGQRQRIAIARALVRDPKLLLLDEATSALDSENEYLIQKALEKLMQGRTTFVIAHRLSTIMKADTIVLMNHGRIEAVGRHQELLVRSPLYARLAELQFKTVA